MLPKLTIQERFWSKVRAGDPRLCWEWGAARTGTGYGNFVLRKDKFVPAHRFAYELLTGNIPDGLFIDHLCRNRACVNPLHLEAVSNRENLLRGETIPARHASQTHCKHGHELTPENTVIRKRKEGGRRCIACETPATCIDCGQPCTKTRCWSCYRKIRWPVAGRMCQ